MRILLASLFLAVVIGSCIQDDCEMVSVYQVMDPVFTPINEIREGIQISHEKQTDYGKIYLYNNYLLVNEPYKGIHFYNNQDIASPEHLLFLKIPGNVDMVVRNGILYADSYIDLITLDIHDLSNISEIDREYNVFNNTYAVYEANGILSVITGYKESEVSYENESCNGGYYFYNRGENALVAISTDWNSVSSSPVSNIGVGGSMARFTALDQHLYTVDYSQLRSFFIGSKQTIPVDSQYVDWTIETIFPYQDNLFIGTESGMYIFSVLNSGRPEFLSEFQHVNACDPVVVDYPYAYVTLRSGTECQGFTNQLEIIDITDLRAPKLAYVYPMENPHGLSIYNNQLFLCEGEHGLKIFDVSNPGEIDHNLLSTIDIHAWDVIVHNNRMIITGENGILQRRLDDESLYPLP